MCAGARASFVIVDELAALGADLDRAATSGPQGRTAVGAPAPKPSEPDGSRPAFEGADKKLPRDMAELEDAFVRLHALERRMPGGGRWPFAGDGPWELIQRDRDEAPELEDRSDTLIETEAGKLLEVRKLQSRMPRTPLDAGEVAEYERLKGWLLRAAPGERALIWRATAMLHRGEPRPAFGELKRALNYPRTPRRLAQVYALAMWGVVAALNGKPRLWARRKAGDL